MHLKTLIRLQPQLDEILYSSDSGGQHFLTKFVFTKIPFLLPPLFRQYQQNWDLIKSRKHVLNVLLLFKDHSTVKDNKSCPTTNWRVVGGGMDFIRISPPASLTETS